MKPNLLTSLNRRLKNVLRSTLFLPLSLKRVRSNCLKKKRKKKKSLRTNWLIRVSTIKKRTPIPMNSFSAKKCGSILALKTRLRYHNLHDIQTKPNSEHDCAHGY